MVTEILIMLTTLEEAPLEQQLTVLILVSYGMSLKTLMNEEKIDYHNDGFVRWSGVFGQLEYSNDDLSVFVQGASV